MFLITRNIPDMAAIINGGVKLQEFNVGNISAKDGSTQIKKSVNVTPKDIEIIKTNLNNKCFNSEELALFVILESTFSN